jgi:hypothetical protein
MYGVDQCRVCGTPIPPLGPKALEEQQKANRKPPIPEAEWRKMGLLTAPTKFQLRSQPGDGCCRPCGLKMMNRKYHYNTRLAIAIAAAVTLAAFVTIVVTFLAH